MKIDNYISITQEGGKPYVAPACIFCFLMVQSPITSSFTTETDSVGSDGDEPFENASDYHAGIWDEGTDFDGTLD